MKEPLILLLETATDVCSVGLCLGERLLSLRESDEGQDHAASVTLFIQAVLEEAGKALPEIDAVAISGGPGSYTSLRIGAATAKGICYALGKPLIAADTLHSLALASRSALPDAHWHCPMIDARRMEVYAALFDADMQREWDTRAVVLERAVFEPYLAQGRPIALCGSGAAKALALFEPGEAVHVAQRCSAPLLIPAALQAFRESAFQDIAYYTPAYLKPPNITVPSGKKLI
ncbi:MAG: tRNA (adenosine(37)-N6)-threonylcarbamoyltransferase complex dimerization subunit type 1 TsaB [Saprospiraceae bacterium]|nr:tRNA (adenosine(37)-N6)-threonylcarbamoyltransferase complex dimerization subunit type 1 TsaB [Saprospiraceae bacterium]